MYKNVKPKKSLTFLEPDSGNEKYFQTKNWYIINDQNNGQYQDTSTIKFNTEVIKPNLCDYGDAYILVTGNAKIINGRNINTRFCFKNTPFRRSVLHLNDTHIKAAENLNLEMKHYYLIEYSDDYQDTVGYLYQFKRDEQPFDDNEVNIVDITTANSSSFKYKSSLINRSDTQDDGDGIGANDEIFKNVQIPVPLKYISSFFRSLELPLINTKLNLELSWTKNCLLINIVTNENTPFQITKTELYVHVVTLNTNDNKKLNYLLSKGFKRSVFWNEYKSKIETHTSDANNLKRILLDSSFQGVNRLFVLSYLYHGGVNAIDINSKTKYVLPRENLTKFNVLIDGRNFYDQLI